MKSPVLALAVVWSALLPQYAPGQEYLGTPRFLPVQLQGPFVSRMPAVIPPFSYIVSLDGLPSQISLGNAPIIDSMVLSNVDGPAIGKRTASADVTNSGYSFLARTSSALLLEQGTLHRAHIEFFVERSKESPRLTLSMRSVILTTAIYSPIYTFFLPQEFDVVSTTFGDGRWIPLAPIGWGYERRKECAAITKFTSSTSGRSFAVVTLPGSGDVREWFVNDYRRIKSLPEIRWLYRSGSGSLVFNIRADTMSIAAGETVEQRLLLIALKDSLDNPANYYSRVMSENFGPYFPTEGYSTRRYSLTQGFSFLHPDGFSWGWSTYGFDYMKFLLGISPDSLNGFFEEEKKRHALYFLEHQSGYGLVPYGIMSEPLRKQTIHPEKLTTDFMFAQTGVLDVEYLSRLLPTLPAEEARLISKRLALLRTLYEPENPRSWTLEDSLGGYWFEYSNLWKIEGKEMHILNTHVTALHLAVNMQQVSRTMEDSSGLHFWLNVVRKGTDALIRYLADDRNWSGTENGKRELAYSRFGKPNGHYHDATVLELKSFFNGSTSYRGHEVLSLIR